MKRRDFIKNAGLITAGSCCLPAFGGMLKKGSKKPNILIIHTDQQSNWTLGIYGGKVVKTPFIDSIGNEGAVCKNFFVNSPVSTPSRGCLLSGRYPHSHGAFTNDVRIRQDIECIAHVFKNSGYHTGYSGKLHLDGDAKPGFVKDEFIGFEDTKYMYNRGHWKKLTEDAQNHVTAHPYRVVGQGKDFTTDFLADKTIDFINQKHDKPFFYMVSIPDPHGPHSVRAPYDTIFKPEDMEIPETFNDPNVPSWINKRVPRTSKGINKLKKKLTQYCGMVKCIDDNVGRILKALENKGIKDDTIIVFTSDHGDYMGEHGLMNKGQFYIADVNVPMLIRWPKKIKAGTVVNNHISTVDMKQTLAGLAGISTNGEGFDKSIDITNKSSKEDNTVFIHNAAMRWTGTYDKEYALCLNRTGKENLLYKRSDLNQTNNLFYKKEYKNIVDKYTNELFEHHSKRETLIWNDWLKEYKEKGERYTGTIKSPNFKKYKAEFRRKNG